MNTTPEKKEKISRIPTIRIQRKTKIEQLIKGNQKSTGYDIAYSGEKTSLKPGEIKILETGLELQMPKNIEGQIRPRWELSTKGFTIISGTIDPEEEIKIIGINLGKDEIEIDKGQKIAQVVFNRIINVKIQEGFETKQSRRRSGGFGSPGQPTQEPKK